MFPCDPLTCVAGLTGALVAVDLVDAGPEVALVVLAVVDVDFTVDSWHRLSSFSDSEGQRSVVSALSGVMCVVPVVPLGQLQT